VRKSHAMRAVIAAAMLLPVAAVGGNLEAPVIGGSDAPQGMWPATAAILYGSASNPGSANSDPQTSFECSGVLVAPTVVLTAGHCVPSVTAGSDEGYIGDLTGVLIGASSLADPSQGQLIVATNNDITAYPSSQTSIDIGIIKLETASTLTPAPIADGWAKFDISNGAKVEFVGYGAINSSGSMYVPQEQEAQSTITDYDCSQSSGCRAAAMPDGELGAGGSGIDTCPGDSGGGMYLLTSYGTFVAGITSRGYDTNTLDCSQGGIYERPDKIVSYIEQQTGATLAHGPMPSAPAISAVQNALGTTTIDANDPKTDEHHYAITAGPTNGKAAVSEAGDVRFCAGSTTGSDALTIDVTDANDSTRSVPVTIAIDVASGAGSGACVVDDFPSAGCCSVGGSGSGSALLAFVVGAMLVRRRRA
jgi:secreted trypsin-like serine protease